MLTGLLSHVNWALSSSMSNFRECPECELRLTQFLRTQHLQLPHNTRRYRLPFWVPGLSGWGYAGVLRPYIVGLLVCLPAKSPRESPPLPLWARTHEEEDHNEPKRAMGRGSRTDTTGRRRSSLTNYCWSRICQG